MALNRIGTLKTVDGSQLGKSAKLEVAYIKKGREMDDLLTQEWTARVVLEIAQLGIDGHAVAFREAYQKVADAHNAAIAAAIEADRLKRRDVLGWEQGYKCGKAEERAKR